MKGAFSVRQELFQSPLDTNMTKEGGKLRRNLLSMLKSDKDCLANQNLSKSDLISQDLSDFNLLGSDFSGNDLRGVNFASCSLIKANFANSNLLRAYFCPSVSQELSDNLISLAHDGANKLLIAIFGKQAIDIYDVDSNILINSITCHRDDIEFLDFSSDCQFITSISHSLRVLQWEIRTGKLCKRSKGLSGLVSYVFSPDFSTQTASIHDPIVKIWEFSSIMTIHGIAEDIYYTRNFCFSRDHKYAVFFNRHMKMVLWNTRSRKVEFVTHTGITASVSSFKISANFKFIGIIIDEGKMLIYRVKQGDLVPRLSRKGMVTSFSFSNDEKSVIWVNQRGIIQTLSLKTKEFDKNYYRNSSVVLPDCSSVALYSAEKQEVSIRSVKNYTLTEQIKSLPKEISLIQFCPELDNTLAISERISHTSRNIQIWDKRMTKQVKSMTCNLLSRQKIMYESKKEMMTENNEPIIAINLNEYQISSIVSPQLFLILYYTNGQRDDVFGCFSSEIYLFDSNNNWEKTVSCYNLSSIAVSRDQMYIILGYIDRTIEFLTSGRVQSKLIVDFAAKSIEISNSNEIFAAIGNKSLICVWDLQTKVLIRQINCFASVIYIDISPDTKYVLSSVACNTFMLFSIDRDKYCYNLERYRTSCIASRKASLVFEEYVS